MDTIANKIESIEENMAVQEKESFNKGIDSRIQTIQSRIDAVNNV